MPLVLSNPTTHDGFSSWTTGTCIGLVPDLDSRGLFDEAARGAEAERRRRSVERRVLPAVGGPLPLLDQILSIFPVG